MTFKEARDRLLKIANGRYCLVRYSQTYPHGTTKCTQNCELYIDGYDWYSDSTWEKAFMQLPLELKPIEEIKC